MNKILNLIGRTKELFVEDIKNNDKELKEIVSSSTFLVIWSGNLNSYKRLKEI